MDVVGLGTPVPDSDVGIEGRGMAGSEPGVFQSLSDVAGGIARGALLHVQVGNEFVVLFVFQGEKKVFVFLGKVLVLSRTLTEEKPSSVKPSLFLFAAFSLAGAAELQTYFLRVGQVGIHRASVGLNKGNCQASSLLCLVTLLH